MCGQSVCTTTIFREERWISARWRRQQALLLVRAYLPFYFSESTNVTAHPTHTVSAWLLAVLAYSLVHQRSILSALAVVGLGEHDFRNFCKMDVANVTHFMRRITSFTVETVSDRGGEASIPAFDMCYLRIEGTAFLWHQVRCMAAVLFMVGNRLEEPTIVADLLDIKKFPQKPQYLMASDQPLVLAECRFKHLQFKIDPEAADRLRQTLYEQWSAHAVAGAMAQYGTTIVLGENGAPTSANLASDGLEDALKNGLQNHIPLEDRAKEDPYDVRRKRHDEREAAKAILKAAH